MGATKANGGHPRMYALVINHFSCEKVQCSVRHQKKILK